MRFLTWRSVVTAMVALLLRAQAQSPCPYYMTPVPMVLLNDGSNSLRLEVFGGPTATEVRWRPNASSPLSIQGAAPCQSAPAEFTLRDDGTQGDRVAGDKIFTIDNVRYRRSNEPFCSAVVFRDLNEPEGFSHIGIGALTLITPAGPVALDGSFNFTTFFLIDADAYRVTDEVTSVSPARQQTAWVNNVREDNLMLEKAMGNLVNTPSAGISLNTAIPTLSGFLPDSYDFRVLVATNETLCPSRITASHLSTRSSAQGIGIAPFDRSSQYQAGPNLLGVTMVSYQGIASAAIFYHETNHQWGAQLPAAGLSDAGQHWLPNSSVAGSLGGCSWKDNGDGSFTSEGTFRPTRDNGDLELYLAGLIPASSVQPIYVATNASQSFCTAGAKIAGPFRKVTIDEIVAQYGARTPGPAASKKDFKQAVTVVSGNRLLTPLEMTFFGHIAQLCEGSTVETLTGRPLAWSEYTRGLSTFNFELDSFSGPMLRATGVVNAATGRGGRIAPGEIIAVYGAGLGPAALSTLALENGAVSKSLAGTRVLFDGVPAPIVYTSKGQLSVIVPYSVAGHNYSSIQVEYQGKLSGMVRVPVAPTSPAIFTQDQSGAGPGAILNQDSSLNTAANPAARGSVVQVFGTGEGVTIPPSVDGQINDVSFPKPVAAVSATIDGQPATVAYAGAAPGGIAGLFQLNLFVPQSAGAGAVPIQIRIGNAGSRPDVTAFVK